LSRTFSEIAFAAALLFAKRADAHLVTTGLGPVYDGIGHLLLTPEDLVPILALALYAGLRGARAGRLALFILPVAWMAGGLLGIRGGASPAAAAGIAPVPALSFVLLGVLVAADLRLPDGAVATLTAALGLVHGFLNGPALAGTGQGALGLIGIAAVAFVLVALAAAPVVSLKAPAARVAVRVAGSWIAAVGLLLLGWAFRTRGAVHVPGFLAP
jgi:hydrogenase/urease accessory protein HupE